MYSFEYKSGSSATPTATSAVTSTPTLTRTPTADRTPTPPPTTGSIKVQFFNQNRTDITNHLYLNFQLVNTGSSPVTLSNVKLSYYYTTDGAKAQNFHCEYSPVGSGNVTGTFFNMATHKTGPGNYKS